jgi:hypothetical protein
MRRSGSVTDTPSRSAADLGIVLIMAPVSTLKGTRTRPFRVPATTISSPAFSTRITCFGGAFSVSGSSTAAGTSSLGGGSARRVGNSLEVTPVRCRSGMRVGSSVKWTWPRSSTQR